MTTLKVGDVTIDCVYECDASNALNRILPQATKAEVERIGWLYPHFVTPEGRLKGDIQAVCVKTPDRRMIVDTCVGNDKVRPLRPEWDRLQTDVLERLGKLGFGQDQVDTVMCTHLHVDHVGWNTRLVGGKWVPTFPKAKYLMARDELEHWQNEDAELPQQVLADSVQPIFDAGLAKAVAMDYEIGDGIRLIPTPGHTPGHVAVLIESRGERALITGDFVHHPCQIAHPHWSSNVDSDPELAAYTRRRIFDMYADTPTLIVGTHFAAPTAGRLVRDGDAYRLDV